MLMAASIATATVPRKQCTILPRVRCNVAIPVVNAPSNYRPLSEKLSALFVDVLLRLESIDEPLDGLLLQIGRSSSLCFLRVAGRASEVA